MSRKLHSEQKEVGNDLRNKDISVTPTMAETSDLYLFDLLWSDGRDITGKTVLQRRERLEQIINPFPGIQFGGYVENRGIDLYVG